MKLRIRGPRPAIIASLALTIAAAAAVVANITTSDTALATSGRSRHWVGAWSTAQAVPGPANAAVYAGFNDQSIRMLVRTSISGDSVRIRLANTFGDRHLTIGHATVSLPDLSTPARGDIDATTVHAVTFADSQSVLIPRGSEALSDPITLPVAALQELVVTVHLPTPTGPPTFHNVASAHAYIGAGDLTTSTSADPFTIFRTNTYFLSGVDVLTSHAEESIVVLGDSIVDGAFSTFNGYGRWTDRLAERLHAAREPNQDEVGVLNTGIGGNQLTHDGSEVGPTGSPGLGVSGLARIDRDAFAQPGVDTVIFCLGVNDIQLSNDPAERVIAGLRQAAAQLRAMDLKAVGCTIMPFEGYVNWTPAKETVRQAVNSYLRTSDDFQYIIDFDVVMRDPAAPTRLRAEWDSGDHIHPNPAGYAVMGDAVPLRVLD